MHAVLSGQAVGASPHIEEAYVYQGGCQCAKMLFEVEADLNQVIACNCSICAKHGLLWTFVGAEKFKLVSGERELIEYLFHKKEIHHLFCRCCGVETFGRGTAPDGKGDGGHQCPLPRWHRHRGAENDAVRR
jgi:hypothetical protein